MSQAKTSFSQRQYDLLVIGGGINGAAMANLAAMNGLRVALVEKGDFAGGTSSKSTKLMHGGLRYLEYFEFGLVREALKERTIQLNSAPHLVKPLEFVIPVYKDDPRPLWMMKLGVWLYDFLSGRHLIQKHRFLKIDEVEQLIPGINPQGLVGGITYYDAQMDDARLCLENVLNARQNGAQISNYCEVVSFLKENGRVVGARCRDVFGQNEIEIRARETVAAVGPWTNQLIKVDNPRGPKRLRTTKGIHIIYRKQISDRAMLLQTTNDQRIFFVIPWKNHSLIGTTDTDYTGSPDKVTATNQDIDYLINEAKRVFPDIPFAKEEIVTTFAGLRPLVFKEGSPSRISRQHVIEESYSGITYILGGKYTTYRKIAEECLIKLFPKKTLRSNIPFPIYGGGVIKEKAEKIAQDYDIDEDVVEYLRSKYGTRYIDVLELTLDDPRLKEPICSCCPDIVAQIVYSLKVEMACTIDDIIWRRLGIGYVECQSKTCGKAIKQYFSQWKR